MNSVLILIVVNTLLIGVLGLLSGWYPSSISSYIIYYSKWIAMLFIPYILLSIKKIQSIKILSSLIIFLPAIIMSYLVLKNYYLLFTGQILQGGFSRGGFIKPSHLKLILTGLVILANYRYYKKHVISDAESNVN